MVGDASSDSLLQKRDYILEGFTADSSLTPQQIRAQIERILNSEWFVRSVRIQRLLTYLVESVLAGQQERLKESVIGIEVFDRPPDYDPKSDSIVRVEMRRARSKLRNYYSQGQADEVLIWLDKGSYVPIFAARTRQALNQVAVAAPAGPASLTVETVPLLPRQTKDTPWSKPDSRLWSLIAIAGVSLIVLLSAYWLYVPTSAPRLQRTLRLFPLTGNAGLEISPAFSPDSKQVAYSWNGNQSNLDIYIKPVEGGSPHRLTDHSAHDVHPAWSPEGQKIAFLRVFPQKTQLITVPVTGGVETVMSEVVAVTTIPWHPDQPDGSEASGPVWSRDASYLLLSKYPLLVEDAAKLEGLGIIKIYLDGHQEMLTNPSPGQFDCDPVISPSGKKIAFVRVSGANAGDIFVTPALGGQLSRLTSAGRDIQGLTWLDEDHLLYSSAEGGNFRLYQVAIAGGQPQLFPAYNAQPQWPSVSPDGHWLAFVESRTDASIWQIALSGNKPSAPAQLFLTSASEDSSPAYSPDGKKIVFVSSRTGNRQLWLADSDGTEVRQLTSFAGSTLGSPQWAPDNRRIVFDASLNGRSAIWLIDEDGSNLHRLNSSVVREYVPRWSRDGRWVYYMALRDGKDQLWRQNPESGEAKWVTNEVCFNAVESPVDNLLYCQVPRKGISQMPLAGGKLTPVPELADARPARYWTLVGDNLYFVRQEQAPRELDVFNVRSRRIRKLADITGEIVPGAPGLAVSPDSRSLLFVQKNQLRSSIILQER